MTALRALSRAKAPFAALAAAFLLSACVDPVTGVPVGTPAAEGPALPKPEDNVYVAKSDNGFEMPALPVEEIPEPFRRQVVAYETDQPPGPSSSTRRRRCSTT